MDNNQAQKINDAAKAFNDALEKITGHGGCVMWGVFSKDNKFATGTTHSEIFNKDSKTKEELEKLIYRMLINSGKVFKWE